MPPSTAGRPPVPPTGRPAGRWHPPALPSLRRRAARNRPGRWARALRAATWAALLASLAALGLVVIGPRTGAYRLATVLSDSMRPSWAAGDVVVSTPEPIADLRAGQVVTFTPPDGVPPSVTHRVTSVRPVGAARVITTRGDANTAPDPWGRIRVSGPTVWRVRFAIPRLGWALEVLTSRAVVVATSIVAPLLLLVVLLARIWRREAAGPVRDAR